jgi:hypothetical protein
MTVMTDKPPKDQKCASTMSANDEIAFWVAIFICLVTALN